MGYFSFTCAKTGLPILGASNAPQKFSRVVRLTRAGGVERGLYDGYGRIEGVDDHEDDEALHVGPGGARLVLEHFYAGERYDDLGDSGHDPNQGCGVQEDFDEWMFLAQEHVPGFDGREYAKRAQEFQTLCELVQGHRAAVHRISSSALHEMRWVLPRLAYCQDEEDLARELQPIWTRLTEQWDGGGFPEEHLLHGKNPKEALIALDAEFRAAEKLLAREVIDAWVQKRAARAPRPEALLRGDLAAGWQDAPLAKPPRRLRP